MTAVAVPPGRGRAWAYAGAGLGAVASVAANVAHSYVPPVGAGPGWQPWVGSVISAVFWPLALLVAVEVFSRIDWPAGARWVVLRWLGLVPLMAVVAVVSYQHMSGLLAFHGAGWFERTVGPGGVDGLMVLCSAALVARTVQVVAAQVMEADQDVDQDLAEELARLRESIPDQLDRAELDSLRQGLLDEVRAMLDREGKARQPRARVKAPEPPAKARPAEWTEAVGLLRASGVIKQTAYNRANAAERDGRLLELIAELRTPRPVPEAELVAR